MATDTSSSLFANAQGFEDASLNATAVQEQLLYDGWLLRFADVPAKRMRSINLVGSPTSELSLQDRLNRCQSLYQEKNLPLLFRLNSLGEGPQLDRQLDELGYVRSDETLVMGRSLDMPANAPAPSTSGAICQPIEPAAFADVLGQLKGSSEGAVQSHARRLQTLACQALPFCVERTGDPIAAGLVVIDDVFAGIYDVAVATSHRRKGWGGLLVCRLMAEAALRGARWAYLQVDAHNQAACRLYQRLGFQDVYTYWYRTAPQAPSQTETQ